MQRCGSEKLEREDEDLPVMRGLDLFVIDSNGGLNIAINSHDRRGDMVKLLPSLRATYGIFLIGNLKSLRV